MEFVILIFIAMGLTLFFSLVVPNMKDRQKKREALKYVNKWELKFISKLHGTVWVYERTPYNNKRTWDEVDLDPYTEELCQIVIWFQNLKSEKKSLVSYAKTLDERQALAADLDVLKYRFNGMVGIHNTYHQKAIWGQALEYLQDQQAALLMLLNQAGQPINEAQKQRQEASQQAEVEPHKLTNIGGVALIFKDQGRATAFRLEYVPKGDYSIRFGERSVEMATSDGKMDVPINLFSSTPLASGRLVITSLQNQQADEVLW